MTREEAINEWTFRSDHIKKWLDEYGEEPSIRHYVELIDMAIEALQREDRFLKSMDTNEPLYTEVVRCKDCRYYSPIDENKPYPCEVGIVVCNKDDYCSYGERKE